jgi:uncharacterized protein YabN with tetrapyrrole methylase and pyrophosphatase domain
MHKSWEVQNEASALGFDWSNISDVIKKVKEEIEEIEEALGRQDTKHAAEELGDLFFASVNLARFLDVHPSDVMHAANTKFSRRFSQVKAIVDARNLDMRRCSLKDLDAIWDEVKRREHGEKK